MAKPAPSPLALAVATFDDELAAYARLAELFLKTPLDSVKHLERANTTLGEIAAIEERLQAAGQGLLQALSGARARQEQLSKDVVAHAPALGARNQQLRDLMDRMSALAADVAALHASVQQDGDVTGPAQTADPIAVSERVLALSGRAAELAHAAQEAALPEVATQAHALHQRLAAIGAKLQRAAGN
jgi:hypothetical protein